MEAAYLSQEISCRGSYSHEAGLVHCTGQVREDQPSNTNSCLARPSMQLGGGHPTGQEGKEGEGRDDKEGEGRGDKEREGEAMEGRMGQGREEDRGLEGREVVLPFRVHISLSGRVTVVLRCSCGGSHSSVTALRNLLMYNRVPKTGSMSLLGLMKGLMGPQHYEVCNHINTGVNR